MRCKFGNRAFDCDQFAVRTAIANKAQICANCDAKRTPPLSVLQNGPAARCKPKMIDLKQLVLRFCIRPIDGAFELLAIMDIRAFDLIRVSAPKARRAT